jgi:hypothetical protein
VTALAHQFAGLISPLHGSVSADNLSGKLTILPDNEVSPLMLAGPKQAVSGPKEPPRLNRAIADNWPGLYGSDPFSSMSRRAAFRILRNGAICPNISIFAGFFPARMTAFRITEPADISDP